MNLGLLLLFKGVPVIQTNLKGDLPEDNTAINWFLEVNPDGKVPLAKFDENWISDCDAIVGLIEDKYPDPSLATSPELASVYSLYICHMTIGMSQ
ncbi:putative glutathione dehydrogenase (ascorbate) [Helianthus debilis subsp. tardiflorus]